MLERALSLSLAHVKVIIATYHKPVLPALFDGRLIPNNTFS